MSSFKVTDNEQRNEQSNDDRLIDKDEDRDDEECSEEDEEEEEEEGEEDKATSTKQSTFSFSMAHTLSMVRRRQEEKQMAEEEERKARDLVRKEKVREKARKHRQNQRAKAARLKAELAELKKAATTITNEIITDSFDNQAIEPPLKNKESCDSQQIRENGRENPSTIEEKPLLKVVSESAEGEGTSKPVKRPNPFVPRALMLKKTNTK